MDGPLINGILLALVVILATLLVVRHRQAAKVGPLVNLEQVLDNLKKNLLTSRTEGNIQKVASQLSDILINNLKSEKILFFRKQRRSLEMNYVYGLKNIQRSRYRLKLNDALLAKLTDGTVIRHPRELDSLLGKELSDLLTRENFNVVFPIFWMDNLFGVYFIGNELPATNPLVNMFLLFLNQNLSVTYHIRRLESSQQLLEDMAENHRRELAQLKSEEVHSATGEGDEDPGHLIEMFSCREVEELVPRLFDKVKAGLKADKLVFVSKPGQEPSAILHYSHGLDKSEFALDSREIQALLGQMHKRRVYETDSLDEFKGAPRLKKTLNRQKIDRITKFSLSESEPGLLFWTGKDKGEEAAGRLLSRLEKVAHRAVGNAREFERIREMSYTDGLTGLYNRRYFLKRLAEEIQRAKRYHRRLGLLLFDIDDFKLYNDNFGHQWGDELLRRMGSTLSRTLRAIDIVARYGGDEFGIIMPEADKSTCGIFMDRLRGAIAGTDFRDQANGFEGRITISIGSAIFPDDAETSDRLIYCADMALLHSKATGRNCSTAFDPELLVQHQEKL